jgi:hypothetical protein
MAHFFAADGNQDNFDDIGRFAPDSVSQAKVKVGTSFDVALWGATDGPWRERLWRQKPQST